MEILQKIPRRLVPDLDMKEYQQGSENPESKISANGVNERRNRLIDCSAIRRFLLLSHQD